MRLKFSGIFSFFFLFVCVLINAQTKQIQGKVTDEKGKALSGVTVSSADGNITVTDDSGSYTISSAQGIELSYDLESYEMQHQVVGTSSNINITLKSATSESTQNKKLDEVVVTALGIKREKKSLGYGSQEIKAEDLNKSRPTNAVSSLSGNIAGVQITTPSSMGGSTRILSRGIGSITGNNQPLIVVDGMPLDNSNYNSGNTERGAGGRDYGDAMSDINPDDIQSINVLKGGTAAALYGSRAANGAIIITTKKASKGKTEIILNSGISFESINIMPRLQNQYGGGNSNTFQQVAIDNVITGEKGKLFNIMGYSVDESWGPKYNANLKVLPWYAFDPEFSNDYLVETPWVAPKSDVKDFFNTGITTNNSISFAKSFENTNVRLSYANVYTTGILPNSNLSKNTITLSANSKLTDKLTADAAANFIVTEGFNRPEVGYGDNSVAQKFFLFGQRQLDMDKLKDYKLANGNQRTWNRRSYDNGTPRFSDNPYWTIYENTSEDKRNRFYGNAGLTYNFLPNLFITGKVYADTYDLFLSERVAIGSQRLSRYQETRKVFGEYNYEGRLHYNAKINEFSLNSFAGLNKRTRQISSTYEATTGGLIERNLYSVTNSIGSPVLINRLDPNARREDKVIQNSIFYSLSLGYKDFIYLDHTGRNDWSSTLAPGNRSQFYPSISASLILSKYIKTSWLSFSKLRAGWAQVANSSESSDNLLVAFQQSEANFLGNPRFSNFARSGNPDLKFETTVTKEVGLETSLFKSRVGIDITLYERTTSDLITPIEYNPATGFSSKWENAGQMQNKGIEIALNLVPLKYENFEWNLGWNFAMNDNKLISLQDGINGIQIGRAPFDVTLQAFVAQRYGQIYGRDFVYDTNGNKILDTSTGEPLYKPSEIKNLGSILPKYNMGIRNNFKFLNDFNFSFLIDIQKGGKYFSTTHMFGIYSGMLEETAQKSGFIGTNGVMNTIREDGILLEGVVLNTTTGLYEKNTTRTSARGWADSHNAGVSNLNIFDADYIKLRDVSFTYTLPKKILPNVESIQFSVFARNLFAWGLDWKSMDPEMASYGSGNVQGFEGGSLPSTRTYGFNLQVKF